MVAMTMRAGDDGWTQAGAAIWNGGGIRASITKGSIKLL